MNEFDQLLTQEKKTKKQQKQIEKKKQEKRAKIEAKKKHQKTSKKSIITIVLLSVFLVIMIGFTIVLALDGATLSLENDQLRTELQEKGSKITEVNKTKKVDEVYRKAASATDVKDIKDSQIEYLRSQLKKEGAVSSEASKSSNVYKELTVAEEKIIQNTDAVNEFFKQYFSLDPNDEGKVANLKSLLKNPDDYSKVEKMDSVFKELNQKGILSTSVTLYHMGTVGDVSDFLVVAPATIENKIVPTLYKVQIDKSFKIVSLEYLGTTDVDYAKLYINNANVKPVVEQQKEETTKEGDSN